MDCVFKQNADGKWECLRCHARYGYLPVRQCDADPEKPKPIPPEPSTLTLAALGLLGLLGFGRRRQQRAA